MKVRVLLVALVGILFVGLISATQAGGVSVQGTWTLTTIVYLANGLPTSAGAQPAFSARQSCEYQGRATVSQTGNSFTGTASLTLKNIPAGDSISCPAEMSAQMTGTVDGMSISGQLDGGALFGMASFTGQVGGSQSAQVMRMKIDAQGAAPGAAGRTSVTQGPYTSNTASWSAARVIDPIPTLGEWGLLLLTGLLMLAGLLFLRPNLA